MMKYDPSRDILTGTLLSYITSEALIPDCISTVQTLHQVFNNEEMYLENQMRKGVTMSKHTMTTLHIKSMNK